MLVDEPMVLQPHSLSQLLAALEPGDVQRLSQGVYEVRSWGGSDFLPGYSHYNNTEPNGFSGEDLPYLPYGVCDHWEQVIAKFPFIVDSEYRFVVTVKRVRKADQEPQGGWRWRKWGDYIGIQRPTTEYIHDEPVIDQVFCFHVYRRMS